MTSYLGIDVGGTKVALRVEGDGRSPLTASFRWPAPGDTARDLAVLAGSVQAIHTRWGFRVDQVGVALPATLDAGGRVTAWPNRPSWLGLALAGALRDMCPGALVGIADDGDLAALAEAAAAGCTDLIYLGVGTGVGGGIVLDGRLCPGPSRGSCEIGHLLIDRAGPPCECGRRGCLQAFSSGSAVLRRAAELRGGACTFTELRDGWVAGVPWAAAAVREACEALATALVGLTELVHPSLAVVGGGFATGLPGFVETVAACVAELDRPGRPQVPVRAAHLVGLSSLGGAVLLARQLSRGRTSADGCTAERTVIRALSV